MVDEDRVDGRELIGLDERGSDDRLSSEVRERIDQRRGAIVDEDRVDGRELIGLDERGSDDRLSSEVRERIDRDRG